MSTVAYPVEGGYSESKEILFYVYQQLIEDDVLVERLRGVFDYEGAARDLALAISPNGQGVRIIEMPRMPEVRVR